MNDRVKGIQAQYDKLTAELSDPAVMADKNLFRQKAKKHAELREIAEKNSEYTALKASLAEAEKMASVEQDPEMRALAQEEAADIAGRMDKIEKIIEELLIPKEPNDSKNAIVEIRAGTGGEEAALFASNLFKLYLLFAERRGLKIEVADSSPTELGGFKEIVFIASGKDAYGLMRYESGTHRVQRVPDTEASGRIHTSAVTVAVMPENEAEEFRLNPDELKIEVCRSSGAGGQHVNKTESAVRIVHLPTGIEVRCQDGRSQIKNKEKALSILSARVKERAEGEEKEKTDSERRAQIGSGDRSEKIRTYNYPQNRVTDHRIGYTSYNLEAVMSGELDEFVSRLADAAKKKRMEAAQ
ncbi:MAG TPA: peptide chain release factor 1 [bacterium]|nr:peptide chain release factor 1 [bacterium]